MIRLYIDASLSVGMDVRVGKEQKHYLEKVMRGCTDALTFNGKDGEFLAGYGQGKLSIHTQTRSFTPLPKKALAFGLIKKHRLAWMIEKACELGATDLYPLITQRVQFHEFNPDRYQRIMIEAAEQCGRMDLPVLHPIQKLGKFLEKLPGELKWHFGSTCHSRASRNPEGPHDFLDSRLRGNDRSVPSAYIIGPEGGFTEEEENNLAQHAHPISMGQLILRAETAALWCLSQSSFPA